MTLVVLADAALEVGRGNRREIEELDPGFESRDDPVPTDIQYHHVVWRKQPHSSTTT